MKRFRKLRRFLFALVVILGIALLLAAILLPYAARTGRLTGFIERRLADALGATARVEAVALAPFSEVTLKGVIVSASDSRGALDPTVRDSKDEVVFRCDSVSIRYNILDLLRGKLVPRGADSMKLDSVSISRPVITLKRRKDGTWNYTPPHGSSQLSVDTIRVENGTLKVTVDDAAYEVSDASITLHGFGPGSRSRVHAHAFIDGPGRDIYAIGELGLGAGGAEGLIRLSVSRLPLDFLAATRATLNDVKAASSPGPAQPPERRRDLSGEVNGSLSLNIEGSKITVADSYFHITGLRFSSADGQITASNVACSVEMDGTEITRGAKLSSHVVARGSVTSGALRVKHFVYPSRRIGAGARADFELAAEILSDSEGWRLATDEPWRLTIPGIAALSARGVIRGTGNHQEVDIYVTAEQLRDAGRERTVDSDLLQGGSAADVNTIRLKGRLDAKNRRVLELVVSAPEIELGELWRKVQPLFLPRMTGWEFGGQLSFDCSLGANLTSIRLSDFDLRDFTFMSPDGEIGCEGLHARLSASTELIMNDGVITRIAFESKGNLSGLDFIAGSFGISLSDESKRAELSANGFYDLRKERLNISFKVDWPHLGALCIKGEVANPLRDPHADLDVVLDNVSNSDVFTQLVKDNYAMLHPFLDDMSLSGKSHLACTLTGSPRRFNLKGDFDCTGASVRIGNLLVDGIEAALPLSLESPPPSQGSAAEEELHSTRAGAAGDKETRDFGRIVIGRVTNGPITLSDLEIEAAVLSNDFVAGQDLTFPLFGGSVRARGVRIRDVFSTHPRPIMGLYVDDLDISKLAKAYNLPAVKGKLKAQFKEITLEGDDLVLKGNAAVGVFGGAVSVGDIKIENPLEEYRIFSFSARLDDIDLGSLSSDAGIAKLGKVTGRLQGSIQNLEIAAGRPMRFDADLETAKRKGVSQTVSLDFVQSLSLVASGAPPVFGQIVKDWGRVYRYDRFGITCTMRYGDILTINGKYVKDGKEFFMQGPQWGGMNIINEDPGKRVSFKEISERFKGMMSGEMPTISTQ